MRRLVLLHKHETHTWFDAAIQARTHVWFGAAFEAPAPSRAPPWLVRCSPPLPSAGGASLPSSSQASCLLHHHRLRQRCCALEPCLPKIAGAAFLVWAVQGACQPRKGFCSCILRVVCAKQNAKKRVRQLKSWKWSTFENVQQNELLHVDFSQSNLPFRTPLQVVCAQN